MLLFRRNRGFFCKHMKNKSKTPIYLDNQATTPVEKRVLEAMLPYFSAEYGNPHSSDHWYGWQSKKATDSARLQVSQLIHSDPDEVIFTSGATEANNIAVLGSLNFLNRRKKTRIIISAFEHKCILEAAKAAQQQGFKITILKPNENGFITPEILLNNIGDDVGLVSVLTVNNEIGTIQPVKELAAISRCAGALFHTDAAQAAAFLNINVTETGADLLSLSAHKIYGPKGIGALFIKREVQKNITPLIFGGGQENGFRPGTLPTMLCVGFGKACEIAALERDKNISYLQNLSYLFCTLLSKNNPNILINGSIQQRHPGNLNIAFPGIDAHSLLQSLQPNIAASTGSACTTGTPEPSHVLRSIGLSDDRAESSVRFSFGLQNTEEEIRSAVTQISDAINNLEESAKLAWG